MSRDEGWKAGTMPSQSRTKAGAVGFPSGPRRVPVDQATSQPCANSPRARVLERAKESRKRGARRRGSAARCRRRNQRGGAHAIPPETNGRPGSAVRPECEGALHASQSGSTASPRSKRPGLSFLKSLRHLLTTPTALSTTPYRSVLLDQHPFASSLHVRLTRVLPAPLPSPRRHCPSLPYPAYHARPLSAPDISYHHRHHSQALQQTSGHALAPRPLHTVILDTARTTS